MMIHVSKSVLTTPGRPRVVAVAVSRLMIAGGLATLGVLQSGASTPLSLDAMVSSSTPAGSQALRSPTVSTAGPAEFLVAFISADGPAAAWAQWISSVSGGGLTWKRAVRSSGQAGTAEVWTAYASSKLTGTSITAVPHAPGFEGSISVAAFKAARPIIARVAQASGPSGAPTVGLRTYVAGGW